MDPAVRRLIEGLHSAGRRCVVAVTGGGASAASALLEVPGASRTVLEVLVPYAERSLVEFLGRTPEQSCSADTARRMAVRAWERASWLAPGEAVAGVGCTASLATDRPKRGEHRFHVAVQTAAAVSSVSLTLTKGARDRSGEEEVVARTLLNSVAEACGVAERVAIPLLPGETPEAETTAAADAIAALVRGEIATVCVARDGRLSANTSRPAAVLPGSFNPVHDGHWGLLRLAERRAGAAAFELSVTNVDKPPLTPEEVRRRLAQFAWRGTVWLTRAPTFAEKARVLPGSLFVVGADTAERIVQARYYGDSEEKMTAALAGIREAGSRFLVAGRRDAAGQFVRSEDLAIPAAFRDLFEGVAEAEFHVDRSSTELRARAAR
jgi:nicotinamide mononucleotide (NMN) deamidase PncC